MCLDLCFHRSCGKVLLSGCSKVMGNEARREMA